MALPRRNKIMKNHVTRFLFPALVAALFLPSLASAQESALAEPGSLALHAAKEYRKAARYPAHSKVLAVGAEDPIRAKMSPQEITSRGQDGEVTSLSLRSAKLGYEAGAPIEFFVRPAGDEVLVVTGEVVSDAGEPVGTLQFFDDGVGADVGAGDGVFSARMLIDKRFRPELATNHRVMVQATFAGGETRHVTGGYLLSNPWARLTGRYRDRIEDGNVVVSAQVQVTEKGRFHLAGTLHSVDGEAIGTAQAAQELEVGRHWIDLSFYGLMFHDRQARGPYGLGSLVLRTTGQMPNAISDLVENAHRTRSVPLKRLNARPAGDPELLQAAEGLEAEATRSRGLVKN
jgi:hypothetical protein